MEKFVHIFFLTVKLKFVGVRKRILELNSLAWKATTQFSDAKMQEALSTLKLQVRENRRDNVEVGCLNASR